jgi:outer membrane lipoprotein LolB
MVFTSLRGVCADLSAGAAALLCQRASAPRVGASTHAGAHPRSCANALPDQRATARGIRASTRVGAQSAPRLALAFCAALLLAACQTTPTRPAPTGAANQTWDVRKAELQRHDQFALKGRVAVAAAGQGFNAKLHWQQTGSRANLALDGPLGVGGVRVSADGSSLTVENSKGERLDSAAAHEELMNKLGFEPPIQSLRYWILGAPDPSHPAEETVDADQRLISLRQDGWQIDYAKYIPIGNAWYPERLTLVRGDVRVRVIVDNWDA